MNQQESITFKVFLIDSSGTSFSAAPFPPFVCSHLIPHLHIRACAPPRHLHEHLYASVSVWMNCLHMCTNIHMFVHVNTNEPFSPFVPFDSCSKTASRASATNDEANDATNDKANMWLVHSSFALPLAQMCKCGITL